MLRTASGSPPRCPSILAHAGVKGFSTQKLRRGWQPAPHVGGAPIRQRRRRKAFRSNVGIWEGPDGKDCDRGPQPGQFMTDVYTDLSKNNAPPNAEARKLRIRLGTGPQRVDWNGR